VGFHKLGHFVNATLVQNRAGWTKTTLVKPDHVGSRFNRVNSPPSIKCNPDPARLSPDDVTLVIAVLRVDN
jgi:hypothetical protein